MVTDKPKHLHFPLLLLHDQLVHPLILHEILARHEKKYSHWLSTCSKFNSKAAFLVKHVKGLLRSAELARDDVVFRVKMAVFSKLLSGLSRRPNISLHLSLNIYC